MLCHKGYQRLGLFYSIYISTWKLEENLRRTRPFIGRGETMPRLWWRNAVHVGKKKVVTLRNFHLWRCRRSNGQEGSTSMVVVVSFSQRLNGLQHDLSVKGEATTYSDMLHRKQRRILWVYIERSLPRVNYLSTNETCNETWKCGSELETERQRIIQEFHGLRVMEMTITYLHAWCGHLTGGFEHP